MAQIVVTHDSFFHPDDVFACAVLEALYGDIHLVRTRNQAILARSIMDPSVIVVDAGGCFDAVLNNYDHHQADCRAMYDSGTLKASAGMVWDHYGRDLLLKLGVFGGLEEVFSEISRKLFEPLDAFDNGQIQYRAVNRDSGETIHPLPATNIIACYNSRERPTDAIQMEGFREAMKIARRVLSATIERTTLLRQAKRIVCESYAATRDPVQYFDGNLPWAEAAQEIPKIKYVVFPNISNSSYTAIAVADMHRPRSPFPCEWRGLSGNELVESSGITGLTFCHRGGFMISSRDKESAMQACRHSLSPTSAPF